MPSRSCETVNLQLLLGTETWGCNDRPEENGRMQRPGVSGWSRMVLDGRRQYEGEGELSRALDSTWNNNGGQLPQQVFHVLKLVLKPIWRESFGCLYCWQAISLLCGFFLAASRPSASIHCALLNRILTSSKSSAHSLLSMTTACHVHALPFLQRPPL